MEGINKYLSDIPSEVKFCDQTMDDFNDEAIKFNLDDLLSKHPSVLMETGSPPASLEEKPPTFSPPIWPSPSAALDSISPQSPVFSTPSTSAPQYPLPIPPSVRMETGSPPASLEEKPPTFSPTIWSSPSAALDSISPAFYPVFSTPSTSAQYPLPTPHSYSMGPPLTSKVVRNRIKR